MPIVGLLKMAEFAGNCYGGVNEDQISANQIGIRLQEKGRKGFFGKTGLFGSSYFSLFENGQEIDSGE